MARWYSPLMSDSVSALPTRKYAADPSQDGARLAYKRCKIDLSSVVISIGDVWRLFAIHGQDRVVELHYSANSDWGPANMDIDIGIYEAGANRAGLVVDADLFGQYDISAGAARTEFFGAGATNPRARGNRLGDLASLSTAQMQEEYDLCATVVANGLGAGGILVVEAVLAPRGG